MMHILFYFQFYGFLFTKATMLDKKMEQYTILPICPTTKMELLFNICLCDLFWIIRKTESPSYADQNAPYVSDDSIVDVIKSLQNDSLNLFKWFPNNSMKTNSDKCHLLTNKKRQGI